jgi:hypothetical protein
MILKDRAGSLRSADTRRVIGPVGRGALLEAQPGGQHDFAASPTDSRRFPDPALYG